jgi:hypothetical protein
MAVRPSRPVPRVGMAARVVLLGASEPGEVEEVIDGGRAVVVGGETYVLHRLTGRYVLEGRPYWDRRVTLIPDDELV